ncbi:MAG: hypothetical protein ABI538_00435 [Pseudoxanthomonas sp.]
MSRNSVACIIPAQLGLPVPVRVEVRVMPWGRALAVDASGQAASIFLCEPACATAGRARFFGD